MVTTETPSLQRLECEPLSNPQASSLTSELLTIILWVDDGAQLLDQCLFSMAGQNYRPLELIAVAAGRDREFLGGMLEEYSGLEPFDHRVLVEQGVGRAEAMNAAIEHARGQYLAFVTADQVVYPDHYVRLLQELSEVPAAWAISGFVRAYLAQMVRGSPFIRWKQEHPLREPFDLLWFHYNRPICSSVVIDRTRIGKFQLALTNNQGPIENDPLFFKLAAVFEPAIVKGIPSCEQRMTRSRAVLEAAPELPNGQMLGSARELNGAVALRLRTLAAVDRAKTQLRLRWPRLYWVAKEISNWGSKVVSGRSLRDNFDRLSRGRS